MKHLCFICIVALAFLGCNNSPSSLANPSQLIPEQFDIVIKINAAESLDNGIKNNDLINEVTTYSDIDNLKQNLQSLTNFGLDSSLIAISTQNKDQLDLCLILKTSNLSGEALNQSGINPDSLLKINEEIKSLSIEDQPYYMKVIDSICFISNSEALTTQAKVSKKPLPEIEALNKLSNSDKMISILVKNDVLNFSSFLNKDEFSNYKFSDYTIFDAEISQNAILWNGITKSQDSTSLINAFKNLIPQENKVANVIPENSAGFKSFTFDDYSSLRANFRTKFEIDTLSGCTGVLNTINEIADVIIETERSVVLSSIDPEATKEILDSEITDETQFRGVPIYTINSVFINDCLYPLIAKSTWNHLTILDGFFVFSQKRATAETYIANYLNKSVLSDTEHYKNLMNELSDESSILIYMNPTELNAFTNVLITDDKKLNIPEYKSSAIQFVYDTDYAHMNAAFTTHKSDKPKNSVTEEFDIKLDNELIISPQLVKNHRTNQMDILTQDINNNLYLISNKGKVFWKKQLDGKIMGNVQQIDTYKNGRLQLVFNTAKRLYVLDRNGKDVNAFPLKFNDDITQPVSVFDYDKKKNYRLMITQGKSVLMYDKNGKIVSGFTYRSAKNRISTQPKHFRIGRKDYIVFAEGNRMEILDRVGKTRINISDNISFSNNEIFLYQNKFTTSSTNGELIQFNSRGDKSTKNLQANSDHKITTTSKTLVVLNDNKLTIKSNSIDLDFGVYTAPNIFYINDKIYVSVTDLQSKKGYLFDSQAKAIANFPVFANSELQLGNIDGDNALELITKGDDNALIVYELN